MKKPIHDYDQRPLPGDEKKTKKKSSISGWGILGTVVIIAVVLFAAFVGTAKFNMLEPRDDYGSGDLVVTPSTEEKTGHLAWCDSIYHQNVSCPKHGKVVIPLEVLEEQEAGHLAWCDSIYHRNVSCPKHGKVKIPRGDCAISLSFPNGGEVSIKTKDKQWVSNKVPAGHLIKITIKPHESPTDVEVLADKLDVEMDGYSASFPRGKKRRHYYTLTCNAQK